MIISKRSWHYRLLALLGWHSRWRGTSLCPYFWKLMAALTLTVGLVPYTVAGMGFSAYAMYAPSIQPLYIEADKAANEAVEEAIAKAKAAELPELTRKQTDRIRGKIAIGPITALKTYWGMTSSFWRITISVSMILGFIAWVVVFGAALVATVIGIGLLGKTVNKHTGVGRAIGTGVGTVVGKPAKATGSIFASWWRAHKEKHCPLIEFED